jgi:Bacterial RNA polymerase, alpha chain C terminal domain
MNGAVLAEQDMVCQHCGHQWPERLIYNVRVSVWSAHVQTLTCPKCCAGWEHLAFRNGPRPAPEPATLAERYADFPVHALDLTTRSLTVLSRRGIRTVGQLLELSDLDLWRLRNMGTVSLGEIIAALARLGLEVRRGGLPAIVTQYLELPQDRESV